MYIYRYICIANLLNHCDPLPRSLATAPDLSQTGPKQCNEFRQDNLTSKPNLYHGIVLAPLLEFRTTNWIHILITVQAQCCTLNPNKSEWLELYATRTVYLTT